MYFRAVCIFFVMGVVSACATVPPEQADAKDPLESINRPIWDFNYKVLDKHVLRPAAVGYKNYMPKPVRSGLVNMSNNLEEPSAVINNLLQAKPADAASSAGRFLLNSTVGLLGLVDVAQYIGLKPKLEEFDEVLGVWGVGTGPYLMLPAYGPTDPRELTGDLVDSAYFPLESLTLWAAAFRFGIDALEARVSLMDQEQLLEDSFDSYIFVKEAYFQRAAFKVYDGSPPQPDIPVQEEEDFESFLNELN